MRNNNFAINSPALLDIYQRAALLKANDERARKLILSGQVAMVYYSYRGQEMIASVIGHLLRDDDKICTIYRGIHDMLAKGFPLRPLWAELAGRVTGSCKGKGGPMHLTYPPKGIMVTTGIVGSSAPIANGLAWAAQINKSDEVSVCSFGDGAANIGAVHEAMNLASAWKLPTIFVCQNNLYAEHTKFEKMTAGENIALRGNSYAMPGVRVDGNDPEAMYAAFAEAVARARAGEGPTILECMTFRFYGHNFGDDDSYIPKVQKAVAMEADPVPRLRSRLIRDGIATEAELAAIDADIEAQIDDAVNFALASEWPTADDLRTDVFAQEIAA